MKKLFRKEQITDYYAMEGHKKVAGWLSSQSLSFIQHLSKIQDDLNIRGNIAEIGVYHGRFFIALCLTMRETEKAIAIDVFEDQHLNIDDTGKGDLRKFTENIHKALGSTNNILILKSDSIDISSYKIFELLNGEKVRLFSVDGCHTSEHTQNDLLLAAKTITPGGVIALDDINNSEWPHVRIGAEQFLKNHKEITPFAISYNKLYLTTDDFSDIYLNLFKKINKTQTTQANHEKILGYKIIRVTMPFPEALFIEDCIKHINFGSNSSCNKTLQNGWSNIEPWGVWSNGNRASIVIDLPSSKITCHKMIISFHAFVTQEHIESQIDIWVNSCFTETIHFRYGQDILNWVYTLPPKYTKLPNLNITFIIRNPISPHSIGLSADKRLLGIGLRYIRFT